MKLYIILGAVFVVALGAFGAYYYVSQADQETDRITQAEETKLSEGEMKELSNKTTGDFQTAMKASEQASTMKADDRVTLWKTQLASENMAVRLKAAQELVKMEGEVADQVRPLLEEVSKNDNEDREVRLLVQKHLGTLALAGLKDEALIQAATRQLTDARVGMRWAAVDALSAAKCATCKAALAGVAKSDADEDLRMVAEMALEEMGATGGEK